MKLLIVLSSVFVAASAQLGGGLAGGWNAQDPSEQLYMEVLSNFTGMGLLKETNGYSIVSIETQVVSGINYRYTLSNGKGHECTVVLYEQTWTNTYEVKQDDCQLSAHQAKRAGGYSEVTDMSDEGLQACISEALDQINMQANSMYRLVESKVSAQSHVVQGMEYKISMTAVESTCMNSGTSQGLTASDCAVSDSSMDGSRWSFNCWYRSWMDGADKLQVSGLTMAKATPDVDVLVNKLNENKIDLKSGVQLLGKDGHDLQSHTIEKLLGQDGHDLVEHTKNLLGGGDDHDLQNHVKDFLKNDNLLSYGARQLLGQDGHDLVNHLKTSLIGGGDHDYQKHGSSNLIGGGDHDYQKHESSNLIGGDDHDYQKHESSNLIGGGDHDYQKHGSSNLIGGDDHDYQNHVSVDILGGDGHDYKSHGGKLLGGDDHDYQNHKLSNMVGGDDHDYCHIGMFKEFQERFNKLYESTQEEKRRFKIFCDNMRTVRKLQQTEKGTAKYGATKFADLTKDEFKQYVGKPWNVTANYWQKKAKIPIQSPPESFDWREHGAVTPVKNQGSCGSCWAFSTTGNIEGQWAIKKKALIPLSEQELVDCDKVDEGCNGGLPSNAYKEIERLGGLETESDYKYEGHDESCEFKKKMAKVYINDSVSISQDEKEMASWLAVNGPISIGINAFAMQFYEGGISHPWKIFCNPKNLDHGVLIVGYGVQGSKPYWIVKNSWGPDWGEKGYYLVYRGAGVCGLNTMCTSAVVE